MKDSFRCQFDNRQPVYSPCVLKYCRVVAVCDGERTSLEGMTQSNSSSSLFFFFLWMLWPLLCTRCGFPWSPSSSICSAPSLRTPWYSDSLWEQALSLPKSVEHGEKAMQQSQSSTLISPCCVTLQKANVPNSYLFFFFPDCNARYWLFMLFNVCGEGLGLAMGGTVLLDTLNAPIVNSRSQHSWKYRDPITSREWVWKPAPAVPLERDHPTHD